MNCWHAPILALVACSLLAAPAALAADQQVASGSRSGRLGPDDPWVEHLAWHPRAWLYHNFLTAEEADHLVKLAAPSMARSTVVDSETGDSVLDPIRTSQGTFLTRYQDEVVRDVEDRMAHWTHLPATYGEDLQVLKYEPGQKYEEHWDWFEEDERKKMDLDETNRIATILIYLTDVEEGGETAFSKSSWLNQTAQMSSRPSECAEAKVFVKPHKGDALLFWDLKPDGQTGDKWSMHAGCPVIHGEKWSATKWLHNGEYGDTSEMKELAEFRASLKCEDIEAACSDWASRGDCLSNAPYMVGKPRVWGHCMVSCNACVPCAKGDLVCQRKSERMRSIVMKEAQLHTAAQRQQEQQQKQQNNTESH